MVTIYIYIYIYIYIGLGVWGVNHRRLEDATEPETLPSYTLTTEDHLAIVSRMYRDSSPNSSVLSDVQKAL